MNCPDRSMARYTYRHRPATFTYVSSTTQRSPTACRHGHAAMPNAGPGSDHERCEASSRHPQRPPRPWPMQQSLLEPGRDRHAHVAAGDWVQRFNVGEPDSTKSVDELQASWKSPGPLRHPEREIEVMVEGRPCRNGGGDDHRACRCELAEPAEHGRTLLGRPVVDVLQQEHQVERSS